MILSGIREKNLRKYIERELSKKDDFENRFSESKINSILILSDESIGHNVDELISNVLGLEISKVKLLIFKENKDKNLVSDIVVSQKDFGFFGKLKNAEHQQMVSLKYDLLINYTIDNYYFNSIVASSDAKFKVGFLNNDERLYDFMISLKDNNISSFNKELKKYLKILNKI
ncbi:DUF6913 domain-containing protein [Urechidicola croceus]|uniref:Uncharacterized protein n=1 Tax=Urechidicola croceus TaxID=1850246 RepID=A0A1D8P3N8_9FLAO|nr:hypothetical protein [Urechidicola croceus]AOW19187.1 hypothetical protein LPB138_00120 [Urechidicola croceus]